MAFLLLIAGVAVAYMGGLRTVEGPVNLLAPQKYRMPNRGIPVQQEMVVNEYRKRYHGRPQTGGNLPFNPNLSTTAVTSPDFFFRNTDFRKAYQRNYRNVALRTDPYRLDPSFKDQTINNKSQHMPEQNVQNLSKWSRELESRPRNRE